MSNNALILIIVMLTSAVVYGLGFRHGWVQGQKSGMADGIAWASQRLEEYNQRRKCGAE